MNDLINRIYGDFDKKNEFPKVKLNLPKFDSSHLTEAVRNMNSAFDNIAKDIREQQDNAMAMEFTKCIGELLRKNGVVPKMTEYTRNFETDKTFETRYGVSIDELDFSEHDKVFEDKIVRLEENVGYYKDSISRVEKNCDKLYNENKELKQRIAELESENKQLKHGIDKMATSKSEWIDRAVEWQQKCEKLESKEKKNTVEVRVPASPIEIATHLINNTCTINELKMIAEHINVYCNGGK